MIPILQPIQLVPLKSISNYSSWKIYSSYGANTLGPLCLWQCFNLLWIMIFSIEIWRIPTKIIIYWNTIYWRVNRFFGMFELWLGHHAKQKYWKTSGNWFSNIIGASSVFPQIFKYSNILSFSSNIQIFKYPQFFL